jgi:hypothetical protein
MKITKLSIAALASIWTACSHAGAITTDKFTGRQLAITNEYALDNGCRGAWECLQNQSQYHIRLSGTLTADKRTQLHCLDLKYQGSSWIFFRTATDQAGTSLRVITTEQRLGTQTSYSGVTESICIVLSKPYIQGIQKNPWQIRAEGKNGSFVVNIAPQIIDEYSALISAWPEHSEPSTAPKIILGLQYKSVTENEETTYTIASITPGGLAERSGLRMGDIITHIDGSKPPPGEQLSAIAQSWSAQNPGTLTVIRSGQPIEIKIKP